MASWERSSSHYFEDWQADFDCAKLFLPSFVCCEECLFFAQLGLGEPTRDSKDSCIYSKEESLQTVEALFSAEMESSEGYSLIALVGWLGDVFEIAEISIWEHSNWVGRLISLPNNARALEVPDTSALLAVLFLTWLTLESPTCVMLVFYILLTDWIFVIDTQEVGLRDVSSLNSFE